MPAQILVVDDEALLRDLLKRSLQHAGYVVHTAQNGDEALTLFSSLPIDLALIDVMMPGMNGHVVCSTIRQESDVPIILLTSLDTPEEIVQGYRAGADDYITKPFQFRDIAIRIETLLRRAATA